MVNRVETLTVILLKGSRESNIGMYMPVKS